MGKGSQRRKAVVSRAEEDLRWKLAYGGITFREFEKRLKELKKNESRSK